MIDVLLFNFILIIVVFFLFRIIFWFLFMVLFMVIFVMIVIEASDFFVIRFLSVIVIVVIVIVIVNRRADLAGHERLRTRHARGSGAEHHGPIVLAGLQGDCTCHSC